MEAPTEQITVRSGYNLSSLSFTPAELHEEIIKYYPDFKISYKPDFRQKTADARPESIDDTYARRDWGWQSEYTLSSMTQQMVKRIQESISKKKVELVD
jgi:nucleoside-diphosphate-sugar epimerase